MRVDVVAHLARGLQVHDGEEVEELLRAGLGEEGVETGAV
jgi:hypothetical protein